MNVTQKQANLLQVNLLLAAGFFFLGLVPAQADAPTQTPAVQTPAVQTPAVSFSPAVLDFGLVPSHARPTQLVTVTFDRRAFSPDHLPTLQPARFSNDVDVSLFAQFNEPASIQVVYQVTVQAEQGGTLRDTLVLTTDKVLSGGQPIALTSGSAELPVLGAVIPSLTAAPGSLDFGNVPLGKRKSVKLAIGYYGPGLVRELAHAEKRDLAHAEKRDLAKLDAEFPPNTPGLANTTVSSSSPLVTAQYPTVFGLNASIWQTWIVTFRSHLPLGRDWAELQFRTQAGYYITVPVTAEVVGPLSLKPHALKKQQPKG